MLEDAARFEADLFHAFLNMLKYIIVKVVKLSLHDLKLLVDSDGRLRVAHDFVHQLWLQILQANLITVVATAWQLLHMNMR